MAFPPGPSLPAVVQSTLWLTRPIATIEACARKYGDAFTLTWIGTGKIVFLSDPAAIKDVFTGDPTALHAGEGNAVVEPVLGKNSLFVLDRAEHLRQRRLLLPPFHGERMQAYGDVMLAATDRALASWKVGRELRIHPEMQEITLEVILRAVFGVEREGLDQLSKVLHGLLDFFNSRAADMFTFLPTKEAARHVQIDLGPWSPWGRFLRLLGNADRAIYDEIARRRTTGARGADVLSMMLDARDAEGGAMSDAELRDELMTLLVAGHETTAGALAWAFEHILSNPHVEKRLQEELAGVGGLGDVGGLGEALQAHLGLGGQVQVHAAEGGAHGPKREARR